MMQLELKVNNVKYSGWEKVSIVKSMTSIAHTFSMEILNGAELSIQNDDIIEILVDGKTFLTGYIDEITASIGDKKMPTRISGRSKTGDLIDSNILTPQQYNKLNVLQIMSNIVSKFGMKVISNIKLSPLEVFNTKVGETYFNAINRLCKQTNTLPISDKDGNIIIVKNDKKDSGIVFKDDDFKSLKYTKKLTYRHDKYVYKKESMIDDVTDGIINDDTVSRFRPFVKVNTEDKTNQDLAKWQYNKNKSEELSLTAVVHGWELEINTIVKIDTEIVQNSFLIKEISYTKDNSGTVSNVTFVSKGLFDV